MKKLIWVFVAALVLPLITHVSADAASVKNIKPREVWSKVERGQVTLIDVRSQGEWQQTGVPQTARLVTLHGPEGITGFMKGMRKVVRGDLRQPVALICRSGNRSSRAAALLAKAGFKTVYNVSNGVMARDGWAQRGLPMTSCGACLPEN